MYKKHLYDVFGSRCDNAEAVTCGFKVMYDQIPHPNVLLDFMAQHNVAVIHLVRQNVLRRLISLHYLRLDHSRSQVTEEQAIKLGAAWKQTPFDATNSSIIRLKGMQNEIDRWRDFVREASMKGVETIEIVYEQLQSPRTCSALLAFVAPELVRGGDPNCSLGTGLSDVRQHSGYRCDNFIANWPEFKADLRNTDMLEASFVDYLIRQCETGVATVSTYLNVSADATP